MPWLAPNGGLFQAKVEYRCVPAIPLTMLSGLPAAHRLRIMQPLWKLKLWLDKPAFARRHN